MSVRDGAQHQRQTQLFRRYLKISLVMNLISGDKTLMTCLSGGDGKIYENIEMFFVAFHVLFFRRFQHCVCVLRIRILIVPLVFAAEPLMKTCVIFLSGRSNVLKVTL